LNDFDRPAFNRGKDDDALSAQLHSPSSHGRSVSLSDFGDMNKRFSPIERQTKSRFQNLPPDLAKELKTTSTPREKRSIPERPRSAFVDRYVKPSPPFRRPMNPVGKTIEREHPKPATLPRGFKDATQLYNHLGIQNTGTQRVDREASPARNQSFRIPDMTGIQSLMDSPHNPIDKHSSSRYLPIQSIPFPEEEKGMSNISVVTDETLFPAFEHCRTRLMPLRTRKFISRV